MPFEIGENIGPYRLVEQLGQGGMATVYKAYHASLDRYVAIKVLHPAFTEDENFLARFTREARVVARLEHPNIVPVYDFSEHDKRPYLVMKFVDGETLKARLQRGNLPRNEIIRVLESIGGALSYAHRQQVLHRDIKPSNVMISADNQYYLTDFGLARIAQSGELTLTSDMMIGTPQYISPEQALSKQDLDERTDIYSFGVMAYELLTGRVPFNADTPFAVIHDHIYSPLPLPRTINPDINESEEKTLLKALAKDPHDRYREIDTFINALASAIRLHPITIAQHATDSTAKSPIIADHSNQLAKPSPSEPKMKSKRSFWIGLSIIALALICVIVGISLLNKPNINWVNQTKATLTGTSAGQVVDLSNAERTLTAAANSKPEKTRLPFKMSDVQQQAWNRLVRAKTQLEANNLIVAMGALDNVMKLAKDDTEFYLKAGDAMAEDDSWLLASYLYINLYRIQTDAIPVEQYYKIAESIFKSAKDPHAKTVYNSVQEDQPLYRIAYARYQLFQGDPEKTREQLSSMLADPKLVAENPQIKLVEAELALYDDNTVGATGILKELLKTNGLMPWVVDEAVTLIQDNNL